MPAIVWHYVPKCFVSYCRILSHWTIRTGFALGIGEIFGRAYQGG